jgi:hypothetical protein
MIAMEVTPVPAFANGAARPESAAKDLQPVRRPQDSELDAFDDVQRDFSELPWSRRQPPGIRRP